MSCSVPSFVEEWPALVRRLLRALAHMHVPDAWRDDVAQEASLRMYRMWHRLDHGRPVWPLVRVVAERVARDETRKHLRDQVTDEVPEGRVEDAESVALRRVETAMVRDALSRLSARDRQILLAEVNEAIPPALGRSALKMGRLRARRRLRALLGDATPSFALLPARRVLSGRWWRLSEKLGSAPPEWMAALLAGAQVLAVAGVALVAPPAGGAARELPRQRLTSAGAERAVVVRYVETTNAEPRGPRRMPARPAEARAATSAPVEGTARRPGTSAGVEALGSTARVHHDENGDRIEVCVDPGSVATECDGEHTAIVYVGRPHAVRELTEELAVP